MPKDNPFVNKPGVLPTIWSYGHRNPQGLAWDPVTGKLWESEHGPQGGDEINIIEPGTQLRLGRHHEGIQPGITKRAERGDGAADRLLHADDRAERHRLLHRHAVSRLEEQPVRQRRSSASSSAVSKSAAARSRTRKSLFNQFGRVHDVVQGPDGYLYVTLQLPGQPMSASTPGMVARLIPQ